MTDRMPDRDCSADIIAALTQARESGRAVYLNGGGSKRHLAGRHCAQDDLDIAGHRGIVDYQPGELVITARGGTPMTELLETLAGENQTLSFEPPLFSGRATVGGTLACNLSGPARPWGGSIRDRVLGVQLINGKAESLNFGGTVMKNVAGYDVSRLQAGAQGTLGVLSEVSLKVVPAPEQTLTLSYQLPADKSLAVMNEHAREPRPLSGAFWHEGTLYLRLSGAASAVAGTRTRWGGEVVAEDTAIWEGLREMRLSFFDGDQPLWRLSGKATAPIAPGYDSLIDWCGAQRWIRGDHPRAEMDQLAQDAGGHATLFRGGDRNREVLTALPAAAKSVQQRLKTSFDPDGILNPGRLYSWL